MEPRVGVAPTMFPCYCFAGRPVTVPATRRKMVVGVGLTPTKRTPPKEVTRSLDLSHVEMVGMA